MNRILGAGICAAIVALSFLLPTAAIADLTLPGGDTPPSSPSIRPQHLGALSAPGTIPIITLGFDDARASQADAAAVMTANHITGTFYLLAGGTVWGLDHPSFLTTAQAKTMEANGQEIGGHTRNHLDLRTLSTADQNTEICGNRNDLINAGFKPPISFAYPYGYYNASAESVAQSCGYTNSRSTDAGVDTIPVADPMATRLLGWTNTPGPSLADMQGWVTSAEQTGVPWTQLLWHDVTSAANPGWGDVYHQDIAQFTQFVVWLKGEANAGRVVIKTAGQVMSAQTSGSTVLVNPVRVADSRQGLGFSTFAAGSTNNLQIPAIPSSSGVILNVTVTNSASAGWVTLWPSGAQQSSTSTINLQPGITVANGTSVRVGANNTISVFSSTKTDIIVDLLGYITH